VLKYCLKFWTIHVCLVFVIFSLLSVTLRVRALCMTLNSLTQFYNLWWWKSDQYFTILHY